MRDGWANALVVGACVMGASALASLTTDMASAAQPRVPARSAALPAPSANRGRKGVYHATTSRPGCNYYVCVMGDFTPDAPAGVHVFFHGLGGQQMARSFALWKPYLTAGRCIGINMEYTDGNPHRDAAGKAAAAREAVRQVMADYPVAVGRGALTAFSAGGSPAGAWFKAYGARAAAPSPDWPFSHVNVFGASLNAGTELTARPTSWFRAMGDGEERMAPGLLRYMTRQTAANLTDTRPGACPDVMFLVTKGRGHTIRPEEVALSNDGFRRAATMLAPFLYRPPGVDRNVAAAIDAANAHRFAEALGTKGISAVLKRLIEQQMVRQIEVCRELARTDPSLARVYGNLCARQFAGADAAAKRLAAVLPDEKAVAIRKRWHLQFENIFTGKGITLAPGASDYLREIARAAGPESTIGIMARHYLAFESTAPQGRPVHVGVLAAPPLAG